MQIDNEQKRLEALHAFNILDTPPEEGFERLTALAASIFDVPIALVSFVDQDQQWFKSARGLDVTETPRAHAFCAHTIADTCPMIVENAAADERFCDNPLVSGEPHIRFYAGAPIVTEEGYRLGAFCIVDRQPRTLDATAVMQLQYLADCVYSELKLRQSVCLERQARESAERAMLDRHRMVSKISHEMRTPLNAILGFGELLEEARLDNEEKRYMEAIRRSGADLAQLLQNLFDSKYSYAAETGRPAAPNLPQRLTPAGRLRILVADDVPANLALIKAYVTRLGHDAVLACNGQEAVKLARHDRFDIILMDIQMPVLDGIGAAKRILAETRGPKPPIVAVTCNTSCEEREACAAAGFSAFLPKPVSMESLSQEITRLPLRRAKEAA